MEPLRESRSDGNLHRSFQLPCHGGINIRSQVRMHRHINRYESNSVKRPEEAENTRGGGVNHDAQTFVSQVNYISHCSLSWCHSNLFSLLFPSLLHAPYIFSILVHHNDLISVMCPLYVQENTDGHGLVLNLSSCSTDNDGTTTASMAIPHAHR